jgi:hypothetical protein
MRNYEVMDNIYQRVRIKINDGLSKAEKLLKE